MNKPYVCQEAVATFKFAPFKTEIMLQPCHPRPKKGVEREMDGLQASIGMENLTPTPSQNRT
jgi:hypothetical protein